MKKSLIFACAAVALFASCSQDEVGPSTATSGSDLQQIKIGVTQKSLLATRGTGTVGGVVDGNGAVVGGMVNQWAGESFNLYMFKKGTLDLAMQAFNIDGAQAAAPVAIFDDTEFNAPTGHDGTVSTDLTNYYATTANGDIRYYPAQGAYDFWAYRLDDCEGAAEEAVLSDDETYMYKDFELDGSQDIMVAKAELTTEQLSTLAGLDLDEEAAEARSYSAWTARHDVHPNLKFTHELTRLDFSVKAGNDEAADQTTGIKVEKVEVLSKTTGQIIVAYLPEAEVDGQVVFTAEEEPTADNFDEATDADAAYLVLKERLAGANVELTDLTPTIPASKNDYTDLGEALLVAPQTQYELRISLSQMVKMNVDDDENEKVLSTIETQIQLPEESTDDAFGKGKSYNVKLTLYGLQEIKVTTELTPWEDGGNIEFTPEDDWFEKDEETTTPPASIVVDGVTYYLTQDAAEAAKPADDGKVYELDTEVQDGVTYYAYVEKVTEPEPADPAESIEVDGVTYYLEQPAEPVEDGKEFELVTIDQDGVTYYAWVEKVAEPEPEPGA